MMPTSFSNPSVARRLSLGFAVLVGMLLVVVTLNVIANRGTRDRLREIVEVNNPKSDLAYQMLNHINELGVHPRSIALLTDISEIDKEMALMKAAEANYWKAQKQLIADLNGSGTEQERKLLAEIEGAAKQTMPLALTAAQQGQAGANIEATGILMQQVRPNEQVWRKKVMELVALEDELSRASFATAMSDQARAMLAAGVLAVAAVVLGTLVAWAITRSVKKPIDRAVRVAERIAEGDLTTPVEVSSRDELGRLLAAIGAMQARLRQVVGEIRTAANSVQSASAELATGNQDLSQRTEKTACNIQQTASSMELMAKSVRHSAESASLANQLSSSASGVATRGGEVVSQVVATMEEIDHSSKKISDIIGVIDGIAFQTNILALNAAVEAARAGEQGRGFAVVAGEVRTLARRSAEAAKEIKSLIVTSVEKVEAGSRLVKNAGSTMGEIVASVKRVSDIVGEITSTSAEQSNGIGQINESVTELDHMTQQNAALVEQSAAAASSLQEQATKLTSVVTAFRL
ncbi:MAG TPA: methyl-accepting chemotaxis protein [Rhizobacter sp.]|nr:methyl-accepting chemotaxis protein [Rhizobacter sp.]